MAMPGYGPGPYLFEGPEGLELALDEALGKPVSPAPSNTIGNLSPAEEADIKKQGVMRALLADPAD